jgi:hypothetical protein
MTSLRADLVIHNAQIYTLDASSPWASAIAIRDGRVAYVGIDEGFMSDLDSGAEVLDAGGRFVMPGLVDVHNHHYFAGRGDLYELALSPADGVDEILDAVRVRVAGSPSGEWITGGSWGSRLMPALSTADALRRLDAASGGRPVVLMDESHHLRWINSRAIELLGLDAGTPDPEGGQIVRDQVSKAPLGILIDGASGIADRLVAENTPAEVNSSSVRHAINTLHSFGVTSFQDAGTTLPILDALAHLESEGLLNARVVASLPVTQDSFGAAVAGDDLFALRDKYRSDLVRPEFAKILLDGVPMARTSAFNDPYLPDDTHGACWHGNTTMPSEELTEWVTKCAGQKLSVKIHCTGDSAVRQALDAIGIARSKHGDSVRFHIAHAEFISADDLPRFAELNVVVDLSPAIWFPSAVNEVIASAVGDERVQGMCAHRDLIKSGATLAGGSDWPFVPSPNPWPAIEALITRADPYGMFPGQLGPAQALSGEEALAIYTLNAANAMGLGEVAGSLEPGKSADLVVLDRNPLETSPNDIAATTVLQTYFAGTEVFHAGSSDLDVE